MNFSSSLRIFWFWVKATTSLCKECTLLSLEIISLLKFNKASPNLFRFFFSLIKIFLTSSSSKFFIAVWNWIWYDSVMPKSSHIFWIEEYITFNSSFFISFDSLNSDWLSLFIVFGKDWFFISLCKKICSSLLWTGL